MSMTIDAAIQLGHETGQTANKQWGDWLADHPMSTTHKTARNMSLIAAGIAMGKAGLELNSEEGLAFVKAFLGEMK
jgi:hypothetical protein